MKTKDIVLVALFAALIVVLSLMPPIPVMIFLTAKAAILPKPATDAETITGLPRVSRCQYRVAARALAHAGGAVEPAVAMLFEQLPALEAAVGAPPR